MCACMRVRPFFVSRVCMCVCVCLCSALDELDNALRDLREKMQQAFPWLCNRVNFFYGRHYREAVKNWGVAALLSVCMEEMLHGLPKQPVTLIVVTVVRILSQGASRRRFARPMPDPTGSVWYVFLGFQNQWAKCPPGAGFLRQHMLSRALPCSACPGSGQCHCPSLHLLPSERCAGHAV